MKLKILLATLLVMSLFANSMHGQVTTSTIYGKIADDNGEALVGATIQATHVPSGAFYGVVALDDGRYTIPNMKVGGPYTVQVSFVGYSSSTVEDIRLALGQKLALNFTLQPEGVTIEGVIVTSQRDEILNGDRTGVSTSIDRDMIDKLPTISRSAADFTRLNPMSAEGGSFGGRNDQFNNYSLDGSIFNNPFGLDAATPGGQTDAQPVSLDAIDQITVNIAPFDITKSGFTGASVDAVTKSGTNEFHGSVFGYFRNADMTGDEVDGTEVVTGDLQQLQTGFSLGGPIVKNKVFFFANFELENRSDLGSFFIPDDGSGGGANVSRVLESDMQMISDLLMSEYGYDTGEISGFEHESDNIKGLFKLDFNISNEHKLTASYNFLDAYRDLPAHPSAIGRRGPDFLTLQFQNSGYRINNELHSGIVELNSIFGNKFANQFQAGFTAFRDFREPRSEPFPVVNFGKDGIRYIIAGHEPFSVNNVLDQNVIQIKNNFNIYAGKHTWTIGTSFEQFDFNNSFNLTSYGFRVFGPNIDIADAADVLTSPEFAAEVQGARDAFNNNNANDSWALAETTLGQWSVYGQDEIAVNDQLKLTVGLRMDMPLYFDTPDKIQQNIDSKGGLVADGGVYAPDVTYFDEDGNSVMFDHTELPENNILFNPRIGFNYDLKGDRSQQLRGGTGLFSGRFPFVWIGNQVANPDFFFYNMTDPDFKFPQTWTTSLGYDHKLASGWIATVDLLYSKDLQAAMVRNYGLNLPTGRLSGPGDRPIYLDGDRAQGPFGGSTNAYVFTNTSTGYQFNSSFSIERSWNNTYVKLAYNFLDSKDAASIDAEISSDAYDRNPANIEHTNTPELAPSLYGNRHRVLGVASKKFSYSENKLATTVSLFFEYVEGGRYSYTYSGDINRDGSGLNDLIYIPTDSEINDMNFAGDADAQRTALRNYIAQDDYLSDNQGSFAEKYGALAPWYNHWDLRVLQDFMVGDDKKFQISIDVLNVGNLINSSWGVRQFATQTALIQPIGVVTSETGEPTYSFDTDLNQTFFNDFSLLSRWQLQLGLRFEF